jgi:predicted nucleotidyltransferase
MIGHRRQDNGARGTVQSIPQSVIIPLSMITQKTNIPAEKIEAFCRKWKVIEFALFGSILRDDFRPESDVDVVIELSEGAPWSLFEWVDMIDELKAIFGREVDLVEKSAIINPFRRKAILANREVLYAA